MQKVVGSSPIIRSDKALYTRAFFMGQARPRLEIRQIPAPCDPTGGYG